MYSTNNRLNFASATDIPDYPDFLDIQIKSFSDFFQLETKSDERTDEGLFNTFMENFPISDSRNQFVLEFLDYFVDPPRYSIQECIERGLTYSVPLKARLKLYCTDEEHEDFETIVQDVYLGVIPYMTPSGTFIINGAERVVVSQLHRSPGVFFGQSFHANGTKLYSARVIPFKGSWIEFATDINNVMYAYIDRKKKLPVTTLLRAIGFERDKDILEIFDLAEEVKVSKSGLKKCIGRKLAARVLNSWFEDFVDEDTGEVVSIERNEIVLDRDIIIDKDNIDEILETNTKTILLHKLDGQLSEYAIIHNTLQKDPTNSEKEAVEHIYRQLRNAEPPDEETARGIIDKLFFSDQRYNLGEVGRYRMNKKLGLDIDMEMLVLTKEDIITIIKYLIELINSKAEIDDIDHLSNRRVRTVGEQLSSQFGVGLSRMARTIRERMNVRDNEVFTPIDLINAKTLSSVINSFFGTNQLSQFMDQTNPLAEITHKRRLSALGPGGLSRERAGFEVRDVHYTHYGRLCPIETPEGPNIGLISSLGVFAKVNNLGFIETPYRKVENGVVDLNNHKFLSAEEEEGMLIAQANIPKLMSFMHNFGLITARDPKGEYHAMTDVIHKVLNDLTVDDWSIIIGGDSHTRMSKGVAFGADSGTVALALATGEATMPIPESVKVTFKGDLKQHMDFRDVVHATQAQMLKEFGDNVFQGRIIEVHLGTLPSDQAFTFTDWTAEMKAKASICISQNETLIESLEIAKSRIQVMIDKGMDNHTKVLQGLIDIANNRISEISSGEKPALAPDASAKYYREFVVDLDVINEPMIADPDVNNDDVSKRYTHDTIRPVSYYGGTKKVDLGFVGSCMVHKGDLKIVSQMLKNLEKEAGKVEFHAPLVVAAPTYNIIDELKEEGDWDMLQKYSGFVFNDDAPKNTARTEYENMMYLERPGCNLCMGNQEKAAKGDTVMATSTRLFQGRVVEDSERKKGESLLASTPVVVLSAILGRIPTMEEYETAVKGINLTKFAPPIQAMNN